MDTVPASRMGEVEVESGVFLAQLAAGDEMSIQHLRMEPVARVPEHSHHHEQVGFVYQGEQTVILEDDEALTVMSGESYHLQNNEVHEAENRGNGEVLAIDVFSPPRPNPNWLD